MSEIKLVELNRRLKKSVADLYARVFAGKPWYEIKQCSQCHEAYGKDDDLDRYHDGDKCRRCGNPLALADYWRGKPALDVFEDAVAQSHFIGAGAREEVSELGSSDTKRKGPLLAFSWGFTVPVNDTPSVLFSRVIDLLHENGMRPEHLFYAAETGVDPSFQGRGIGGMVSYARLRSAREAGFEGVTFRTINPKMVAVFGRFFGDTNVRPLFQDPDPVKQDRTWYYCRFDQLQDLPEMPSVTK